MFTFLNSTFALLISSSEWCYSIDTREMCHALECKSELALTGNGCYRCASAWCYNTRVPRGSQWSVLWHVKIVCHCMPTKTQVMMSWFWEWIGWLKVVEMYHPLALRLFLLSTHYRSPVNYSKRQLELSSDRLFYFLQVSSHNLFMYVASATVER